ncbi:MAG: EthD domain-containing protein [Rhodobacter sp.]|nr:EthD domain-containing protein [Rhodobacter sp.]
MVERFVIARGKAGATIAETQQYWRDHHGPLVTGIPEFWDFASSYIQNHALQIEAPGVPVTDFAGVLQIGLKEPADRPEKRFSETAIYRERVRPDEAAFSDPAGSIVLEATSHVVVDGPREGIKVFSFLKRNPAISHEDFVHHWRHVHADLVLSAKDAASFFHRYVQHYVTPGTERCANGEATPHGFDGILEIWVREPRDMGRLYQSAGYQRNVVPDEGNFLMKGGSVRLLLTEFSWPPGHPES